MQKILKLSIYLELKNIIIGIKLTYYLLGEILTVLHQPVNY